MPNTGAMVGESMSCISDHNANNEQRELIKTIFTTLGQVLFMPADKMAAGTAIAGCGIAYVLRLIRAVTEAGVEIGIPAADAAKMAAQISKGAAELILQNESNPEVEIDKVTTPGGVTIAGLNAMENHGFSSSIINGVKSSLQKSIITIHHLIGHSTKKRQHYHKQYCLFLLIVLNLIRDLNYAFKANKYCFTVSSKPK